MDKLLECDASRLDWPGVMTPTGDSSSASQRQAGSQNDCLASSTSGEGGDDKRVKEMPPPSGRGDAPAHALSSGKRAAGRTQVETRYRRNVSEQFEALKNCFGERELAQLVGDRGEADNAHERRQNNVLTGSPDLPPRNKAMVLQGAVIFIREGISRVESQQRRMQALQRKLRQARSALTDTSEASKDRFEETGIAPIVGPPPIVQQTIAWIA